MGKTIDGMSLFAGGGVGETYLADININIKI